MSKRALALLLLVAAVSASVLAATTAGGARPRAKPVRLRAFSSCNTLASYANRYEKRYGDQTTTGTPPATAVPGPGGAREPEAQAAPSPGGAGAAPDYSQTNVQEEGVDEPDLVK